MENLTQAQRRLASNVEVLLSLTQDGEEMLKDLGQVIQGIGGHTRISLHLGSPVVTGILVHPALGLICTFEEHVNALSVCSPASDLDALLWGESCCPQELKLVWIEGRKRGALQAKRRVDDLSIDTRGASLVA